MKFTRESFEGKNEKKRRYIDILQRAACQRYNTAFYKPDALIAFAGKYRSRGKHYRGQSIIYWMHDGYARRVKLNQGTISLFRSTEPKTNISGRYPLCTMIKRILERNIYLQGSFIVLVIDGDR